MSTGGKAYDKLAQRADRAITSLKNFRAQAKLSERRMWTAGESLVGGVVGGLLDGKLGKDGEPAEFWGIPVAAAVGTGAVLLGMSEWIPGGEDILAAGSGMLSYAAGNYTRDAVAKSSE